MEAQFNHCSDEGGIAFKGGKKPIALVEYFLRLANIDRNKQSNILDFLRRFRHNGACCYQP